MKLRIGKRSARTRITVLEVDGELVREGAAELRRACAQIHGRLRLDLSNLRTADGVGIEAIRDLGRGGAELVGASPYISLLLRRSGNG